MDPFYFLDISIVDNEEEIELQDIYDMSPDGSWTLGQGDPLLIYNNEKYNFIEFDNETKILKCIGEVSKTFILKLVDA
jgi:hypothetical protein